MPDERAQPLAVATQRARLGVSVERVAALAVGGRRDPIGEPARQVGVHLLPLDEVDVQGAVAVLGEQQRARRQPVAPGAARLLVVGLERRRDARVHDGPDVRLVDAHAERVGGADHIQVVRQERR